MERTNLALAGVAALALVGAAVTGGLALSGVGGALSLSTNHFAQAAIGSAGLSAGVGLALGGRKIIQLVKENKDLKQKFTAATQELTAATQKLNDFNNDSWKTSDGKWVNGRYMIVCFPNVNPPQTDTRLLICDSGRMEVFVPEGELSEAQKVSRRIQTENIDLKKKIEQLQQPPQPQESPQQQQQQPPPQPETETETF